MTGSHCLVCGCPVIVGPSTCMDCRRDRRDHWATMVVALVLMILVAVATLVGNAYRPVSTPRFLQLPQSDSCLTLAGYALHANDICHAEQHPNIVLRSTD